MMRGLERRRAVSGGAALAVLLLAACGGEPRPVPIVLDEDACAYCRMAISRRELAAELVTPDGRVETFDDLGCLLDRRRESAPPPGTALFVADYETGEWLRAEAATYLRSPALPTPMGHGLAAFASPQAAAAAAERLGGEVLGWPQISGEAAP